MTRKEIISNVLFITIILVFAFPVQAQDFNTTDSSHKQKHLAVVSFGSKNGTAENRYYSTFMLVQKTSDTDLETDKDEDPFDDEFGEDLQEPIVVPDPLYYFNYAMYGFNDFFYLYLLEPVAKGYKTITPTPVRSGVNNFFHNLLFPVRFVSNLLQFEISDAGKEVGIFVVNTTAGVLGFGQVAQNSLGWQTEDEDLGQTFGVWGIDNGFYIVLPILGPSSLRDTIGLVGDSFLTPVNYVEPWELSLGIKAYDTVNATSFRIGDYSALVDGAIDPYEAIKNAYFQTREGEIKK